MNIKPTRKKKKKKHEHQIKEHEQKQTQENEDLTKTREEHRNPALKNIEIKTQAREVNLEKIKNPKYINHNPNLQKIK